MMQDPEPGHIMQALTYQVLTYIQYACCIHVFHMYFISPPPLFPQEGGDGDIKGLAGRAMRICAHKIVIMVIFQYR